VGLSFIKVFCYSRSSPFRAGGSRATFLYFSLLTSFSEQYLFLYKVY